MLPTTSTNNRSASHALALGVGVLLIAACSGSERLAGSTVGPSIPPSTNSGTATSVSAPTSAAPEVSSPPATTPTTSTLLPGVDVPVGVRWQEVELPTDAALSQANRVVSTSAGYVVLGKESQAQGGRPAIWTSPDGDVFTRADTAALSPPGNHLSLFDTAAASNGAIVAVGERSSNCDVLVDDFLSVCYRHSGAAWFSADGVTWQQAESGDGSFDDGIVTRLTQVVPFGTGFVAAGQVILDRNDWRLGLWTSVDGTSWVRSALLADPGALYGWPTMARAGGALVTTVMVTRCETPLEVFGGFGFSVPAQNGRAFTSIDGSTWTPIDLAASGLSRDDGPEACDRNPDGAGFLPSGPTPGTVSQVGDSVLWAGETGVFATADGAAWAAVPDVPNLTEKQDYAVDHVSGRLVGPSTVDLLEVVSGRAERGYAALHVATFDGSTWHVWSELAGGVPAFGKSDSFEVVGFNDIARHAESAVIAVTTSDDSGAVVRARVFLSRPTTFDPTAKATCTPAPAADCADVDLSELDLRGADLTGIDLSRAELDRVDLTGANLSGANLNDSVLTSSDFSGANLGGVSLRRARGSDATLDGADLTAANATDASLGSSIGTVYRDAVLVGATWRSGELANADFRGADLAHAFLFGVDLTGALFEGAAIDDALWGGGTTCPDGYVMADADNDCTGHFAG